MLYKAQYSKLFLFMPMGYFLGSFLVLFISKYEEKMSFVYLIIGFFMALIWMISVLSIKYKIDDNYLIIYFWCFKKKVSLEIVGTFKRVSNCKLSFAAPGENQIEIFNKRNETILRVSPLTIENFINDFSRKIEQ
ncbi:MAG: PH domain-containing protein [Lachnospiraceae bacterium]|nr:PH domain-containing protein [Lachnospiraceae bacterium]